jgi:hypothetical protein
LDLAATAPPVTDAIDAVADCFRAGGYCSRSRSTTTSRPRRWLAYSLDSDWADRLDYQLTRNRHHPRHPARHSRLESA